MNQSVNEFTRQWKGIGQTHEHIGCEENLLMENVAPKFMPPRNDPIVLFLVPNLKFLRLFIIP